MSVESSTNQTEQAIEIAEIKAKRFLAQLEMPLLNEEDRERFFTHSTSWDKLLDIANEGIVSESFAERIGKKDFKKNFPQSHEKWIYFNYSFVRPWKSGPVLIIDPEIKRESAEHHEANMFFSAQGTKFRISHRHILAIILPNSETKEIENVDLETIENTFRNNPKKAIPIFTYELVDESVIDPDTGKGGIFPKVKVVRKIYPPPQF